MADIDVLLALLVAVGAFVVYELFGVDPRFKHLHTISWFAAHHRWLALLIGGLFGGGGVGGVLWWIHHLSGSILK